MRDREVKINVAQPKDIRDGFAKRLSIGYEGYGAQCIVLTNGEFEELCRQVDLARKNVSS